MEERKEPIGDLFQKAFKDAEWSDPDDDQEWNEIAFQLDKKRFYHFSWTRFNIYYSGLIFISLILLIFLVIRSVFIIDSTNESQNNIPVLADSLVQKTNDDKSNQSSLTNKTLESRKSKEIEQTDQSNDLEKVANSDTVQKNPPLETGRQDSIAKQDAAIPQVIAEPPVVKKPKKIVYITKQDTITVMDTLRSRRLRNRQK